MSSETISIAKQREVTQAANAANKRMLKKVRALVIDVRKGTGANGLTTSDADPGASEALPEEPFNALGHKGKVILPPFDLLTLAMLPENSSELNQCIETMETNIESTGFRFVSRLRMDDVTKTEDDAAQDTTGQVTPDQQALLDAARDEKVRLANFFTYCTDESFVQFRRRIRRDIETTGNAYFEVIRNSLNEIQGFTHLPSYQMRLGKMEDEPIEVERKILELQSDGSVKIKIQRVMRRFRTFVQSRSIHQGRTATSLTGHKVVWFKEFGDPRVYSKRDGDMKAVKVGDRASEVFHLKLYSPRSPYGLPRFIGNLLSIFGDRAAEEINWVTFKNNNIPSMVIAVSNGQLTQGTIDRIQSFVESQIQGSDNYSKFLIVEAEPSGEDTGEDGGQVKIEIKPLTKEQHADALFQNYSEKNHDKIRRSFRLPPIFVGQAADYSRSTAESSRRLADEQVFAPERTEFDEVINRLVFPEMGVVYHKFKSNTPNTTDNTQLVKILGGSEKTGGMTPRIARYMLEDILGIDLPDFAPGFPADLPFSLTMAEAVKNQAQPTEPGQQVTALKALGLLSDDGDIDLADIGLDDLDEEDPDSVMDVAKRLLALNRAAEVMWRKQLGAK